MWTWLSLETHKFSINRCICESVSLKNCARLCVRGPKQTPNMSSRTNQELKLEEEGEHTIYVSNLDWSVLQLQRGHFLWGLMEVAGYQSWGDSSWKDIDEFEETWAVWQISQYDKGSISQKVSLALGKRIPSMNSRTPLWNPGRCKEREHWKTTQRRITRGNVNIIGGSCEFISSKKKEENKKYQQQQQQQQQQKKKKKTIGWRIYYIPRFNQRAEVDEAQLYRIFQDVEGLKEVRLVRDFLKRPLASAVWLWDHVHSGGFGLWTMFVGRKGGEFPEVFIGLPLRGLGGKCTDRMLLSKFIERQNNQDLPGIQCYQQAFDNKQK